MSKSSLQMRNKPYLQYLIFIYHHKTFDYQETVMNFTATYCFAYSSEHSHDSKPQ